MKPEIKNAIAAVDKAILKLKDEEPTEENVSMLVRLAETQVSLNINFKE